MQYVPFLGWFLSLNHMQLRLLTDHLFLALNNIALSGWTTVGLFIYLLKGTLVASEFWQL